MSEIVNILHETLPHCYNEEKVLVDTQKYNFSVDNRILIPFVDTKNKIGFYNKKREIVCEPTYDSFFGDCEKEQDIIIVGRYRTVGYKRASGEISVYKYLKYGVIDSSGKLIIEIQYDRIYSNEDSSSFLICNREKYGEINRDGIITIPLGGLTKSCLKKVFHGNYWGGDLYGHFYSCDSRLTTSEQETDL